jgi:hypothetical protein
MEKKVPKVSIMNRRASHSIDTLAGSFQNSLYFGPHQYLPRLNAHGWLEYTPASRKTADAQCLKTTYISVTKSLVEGG